MSARVNLSTLPLEQSKADVIAYAIKDDGNMTGGLPQTLLIECGEELQTALRAGLNECPRQLGDIVWTPAFNMEKTRFVAHIIGAIAETRCADPGQLEASVYQTLYLAEQATGVNQVAFANLATGAGRASAEEMARLTIGPIRRYFRDHRDSRLNVVLCLPDWQDYQAYQSALSRSF